MEDSPSQSPSSLSLMLELERLREENAMLKSALQSAQDLIQIAPAFFGYLSCDGQILDLNDLALQAIETSREQILGKIFWECPWWQSIPESVHWIREAVTAGRDGKTSRFDIEYCAINLGVAQKRWAAVSVAPLHDQLGLVTRMVVTGIDVTERKQTEAALVFERHQLETIFQQSPAAMVLWTGKDFVFEKVNPEYQAIFPDRELQGKPFLEACPEFQGQPFYDLLTNVLQTGQPFVGREILARHARYKGGPIEDHYYDFTYMRVNDAQGRPYGVYDHAIDVTTRVLDRKKLEMAKQEAELANKAKTAFLANMSHEIRTPMTAVLGFSELLRDPLISAAQRADALARIDKSGRTLLRIIDDILDISKIEAGKLSTEKVRFSPFEVIMEITALLQPQAEKKGLILKTSFSHSVPEIASSDPVRIRQILTNLIGNAIKFTQKGKITVEVTTEVREHKQFMIFKVIDSGIGITEQDQKKLFHPFTQVDDSNIRTFGGTGLGLVISKRLSQQLGGDLVILESQPGQGSCFMVHIDAGPFENVLHKKPEMEYATVELGKIRAPHLRLDSTRILVVDDIADNQVLMRAYLESAGAHVEVAGDGEQAVSKAAARDYDIILMDIQMPQMDGIQATKKLRAQGYQRPILAMTAHALHEEVHRSKEAGCDEHLTKPITKQTLVQALKKYAVTS